MLALSVLLYLTTTFFLCIQIFKRLSLSDFLVIFYLTVISLNILICQILSLLEMLNLPWFYLGLQFILCTAITAAILLKKSVNLRESLKSGFTKKSGFKGLDIFLSMLVSFSLGVLFFVGISTPPNNLDSLHTHLTRIYYWLQHGTLAIWPATGLAQLNYPINAHLQGLWLHLLGGSERLFFVVPWLSLVVLCASVNQSARLLNLTARQALVSMLVLMCIPTVLLQTYSFQNDLVVAALASVAAWMLLRYRISKSLFDLGAALLALSLALGVKQSAYLVLPIFVIALVIMMVKKQVEKAHLPWLSLLAGFFLLFSFFKYGQNLVDFHSFFGVDDILSEQEFTLPTLAEKVSYNTPRYLYGMVDFGGLGQNLESRLNEVKAEVFSRLSEKNGVNLESEIYLQPGFDDSERFSYAMQRDMSEDTAWFGSVFFIGVPISLVVILFQKDKPRKVYAALAILHFLLYFLLILLQRPGWDPYQGRYFILGIVFLLPLAGSILPTKAIGQIPVILLLCAAFALITFNVLAMNHSKPLVTARTVANLQNELVLPLPQNTKVQIVAKTYLVKWTNKLIERWPQREPITSLSYYDQLYYSETILSTEIRMILDSLPSTEPIYLLMDRNPLEYGLFGVNRTRELFPVKDAVEVPAAAYLLIDRSQDSPQGFKFIVDSGQFRLYKKD
jgi:hypothetical protein